MKKIMCLMLAVLMLFAATACNSAKKADEEGDSVTISIGGWPQDNTVGYIQNEEILKKFQAKYPDITVEKDNWLYDVQSFLPKAASGQLPTIYNTFFTETSQVFEMGYAKDITDLMKKYEYDKYLKEEILDLVTVDGKIYGIPTEAYSMGLMVNMNLFREAGLVDENGVPKIPQTFEELAETAKTIKDKTGKAGYVIPTTNNLGGWHFMEIAWNYGVKFMEQEANGDWKATFNTPECVEAFKFLHDLKWNEGALPENAFVDLNEMQKLFATDQAAMCFSSNLQPGLITTYSMDRNDIAMGSIPAGPAGRFGLMGGSIMVISNTATDEQAEAAFEWLEFTGKTPKLNDDSREVVDLTYRYSAGVGDDVKAAYDAVGKSFNSNVIVGVPTSGQFKDDCESKVFKNEAAGKYANVDLRLFDGYMNASNVTLRPEEPVCCQQLYSILDGCIQTILTDKDADIEKIVEDANDLFQKNYLDRME